MKKKLLLSIAFSAVFSTMVWAQDKTITGIVVDETGSPVPGATVQVKGTGKGAQTDAEGRYKIEAAEGATLIFRFVGSQQQEKVVGAETVLDVTLSTDLVIGELVVNALGFVEERDNMGASAAQIKADAIAKSGETGVINGMAGKAAGVQIIRSSGDPGAGSSIQIRGNNTLTGSSQPLIVVDGIPVNNESRRSNSEVSTDGVTQQSRLNDLNPDDIASVQVLKGPSAAALWGSRAANGVMVITTKKGAQGKMNISYKATVSVDKINRYHKLQKSYGQGSYNRATHNTFSLYDPNVHRSWGDKIENRAGGEDQVIKEGDPDYIGYFEALDGRKFYQLDYEVRQGANGRPYEHYIGKRSKDVFVDSNKDAVFRTGSFFDHSLSLSGGDEKSTYFLSLGDLSQKGIVKGNSDYNRTTVRFNGSRNFNKYVKASSNMTYSKVTSNRIQRGSNTAGLFLGLLRTSPDFDITAYKGNFVDPVGTTSYGLHRTYTFGEYLGTTEPTFNNPLWTIYEQKNKSEVHRFVSSSEVIVTPVEWLSFIGRAGIDAYTDKRYTFFPKYSSGYPTASSQEETVNERQTNIDLIAKADKNIGEKASVSALVGFNYNRRDFERLGALVSSAIISDPDYVNSENATSENSTPFDREEITLISGGYYTLNFSYDDMLFLNTTGRYERSNSFTDGAFFPAADFAFQFSQLPAFKNNAILSFGKVRGSVGRVGIQPELYRSRTYYQTAFFQETWTPALDAALYGGGFTRDNDMGNPNLKPELVDSWELGADLRFLEDRVRLGATYFHTKNKNALMEVELPVTTGFETLYSNAATLQNKGLELELGADLTTSDDEDGFKWSIDGNLTIIRNKVLSLTGTKTFTLGGFTGSSSNIVEGYPVGSLWGTDFERDDAGKLVLDARGFPKAAAEQSVIGNPNPKWRAGITNTFSYKGISLSVVLETFQKADYWNGTKGALITYGMAGATDLETTVTAEEAATLHVFARAETIDKLYPKNSDGSYTFRGKVHDFGGGPVALTESWYTSLGGGFGAVGSQFVEDASWTRLREVSLSYSLNSKGFKEATKLGSIDFSLSGRNLALFTKWDGIDPETSLTGVGNAKGLEYFGNPNTRSFIFSVKVNY